MGRNRTLGDARLQFWSDIVLAFFTFLTTAAGVLILVPVQHRPSWLTTGFLAWITVTGAGAAFLRALVLARGDFKLFEDEKNRALLNQVGLGLLKEVADSTGVEYFHLGVHVYIYDAGALGNRAWLRTRSETFRRPVRLRYPSDERHAGIPVRPNVGVVGLAYSSRKFVVQPCQRDLAQFEHNEDGWNARPAQDRAGLSHGQLIACRRYGYVAAWAFRDQHGEPAGCVSVDGPAHLEDRMLDHNSEIRDAIVDAGNAIRRTLYDGQ